MNTDRVILSQPTRLAILATYVLVLVVASRVALGAWMPPTSERGLWFYSGLAALLLGNLLVTPFYVKPADAISYAVAALVGLLATNPWWSPQPGRLSLALWSGAAAYILFILIAAVFCIALKNSATIIAQRLSRTLYVVSDALGTPRAIFLVVFLFALLSFHRADPREYVVISLAWAATVALRPLEVIANLLSRVATLWTGSPDLAILGEVVGHQVPGLLLIRHEPQVPVAYGDMLVVPADDGLPTLALAVDHVGLSEGRWLRAAQLTTLPACRERLANVLPSATHAVKVRTADVAAGGVQEPADAVWRDRARLLGFVAPDTNLARLLVEVVRTDMDLSEGRVVRASVSASAVLYQVINGLTKEEIISQKSTRGYVRAEARKIGSWNSDRGGFDPIKWLPLPNTPVFLMEPSRPETHRDAIGYFPETSYPVSVDVEFLVTHNAAILGVLGAGKSFLALELVERMICAGIKVICLDLTDQYAKELPPFYDETTEQGVVGELQAVGAAGSNNVQLNVEDGGSVTTFKEKVIDILRRFLDPDSSERLKIYNPAQFEVWRQDSRPYQGRASMASCTPTEIARVFAEATLEVLQRQGMTDRARCCLVFEEAHSLIPEWNAVASEGDKTATNGTAKAILQGRKYGLGCLVITQRTANVTKTILNQCNTVFALRVFDATGMEFLSNYIGDAYAGVLSTLEDRHAVVFGRASSCRDPVLIRLNEREDFLRAFRNVQAGTAGSVNQ